jgi:hypothetical protein
MAATRGHARSAFYPLKQCWGGPCSARLFYASASGATFFVRCPGQCLQPSLALVICKHEATKDGKMDITHLTCRVDTSLRLSLIPVLSATDG